MKIKHKILCSLTLALAIVCVFSLTLLNFTYSIRFDWYSEFNKSFKLEYRLRIVDVINGKITNKEVINKIIKTSDNFKSIISKDSHLFNIEKTLDFEKYIYFYSTFKNKVPVDSRIKIYGIAQRGNVLEIVVSINYNQPKVNEDFEGYIMEDLVRVEKMAIPHNGKIKIIFKNQYGQEFSQSDELLN